MDESAEAGRSTRHVEVGFRVIENFRLSCLPAANQLLQAVIARASASGATAIALFDAGYLIETYKQAGHLHKGPPPTQDGYGMVVRAISSTATGRPELELAASLMTRGEQAQAHLSRARAAAASTPLLAANIDTLWQ